MKRGRTLSRHLRVALAVTLVIAVLLFVRHLTLYPRGVSVTVPDDVSVDDVIRGDWNYDPGPVRYMPESCRSQTRLAVIGCPRCSPPGLGDVITRLTLTYNVSLALPAGLSSCCCCCCQGWPDPSSPPASPSSSASSPPFSVLAQPVVLNASFLSAVMARHAVLLAVVRHPLHLLQASLRDFPCLAHQHHHHHNLSQGAVVSPLKAFLSTLMNHSLDDSQADSATVPQIPEPPLPPPLTQNESCLPANLSFLRHPMALSLGVPREVLLSQENEDGVLDYIIKHRLDRRFVLPVVWEHLDESLVLLRRLMCWSFKDVLHLGSVSSKGGDCDEEGCCRGCENKTCPVGGDCRCVNGNRVDNRSEDSKCQDCKCKDCKGEDCKCEDSKGEDFKCEDCKCDGNRGTGHRSSRCLDSEPGRSEEEADALRAISDLTPEEVLAHRKWSKVDHALYQHLNGSLWRQVDRQGADFWQDLVYFRYLQRQVRWFCRDVTPYGEATINFPETVLSPAFSVTSRDCHLMETPSLELLKTRRQQQRQQRHERQQQHQ